MNSFFLFCCHLFLIFCISLTSCVSREKQVKKAELHHQLAVSLMRKCRNSAALVELRKALKLKPQDPFVHKSLALLYFQFKKYNKSIEHLKKALKIKPDFTDAHVHLGRSLIEIGKWKEGLKELKKTQEDLTYQNRENLHVHIGLAHYKRKNFFQAEKHFNESRMIKTEDCMTALYHAKSLYYLGKYQKALDILEPAKLWCEKNLSWCSSPSFEPYFFTALAYYKKGNRQKALFHLEIFLEKTKDSEYLEEAKKYQKLWKDPS